MTTPLTLTVNQSSDGATVLTAVGEIDQTNNHALAESLADATTRSAGGALVTVDLTAVEYLDSAGLAALFPYADRIRIHATPLLGPVLTISGLAELTPVQGI